MRPDDLEFLIAQYADGSLDAKRSADLEAVFRRDTDARAMLEAYRAVDGELAGVIASQPVPEVQWDRLEASISRRIATLTAAGPVTEEFEQAVSRLSSGDGLEQELRAIDNAIAADPRSRLLMAEYGALDRAFDAVRTEGKPQVRWDQFARHISSQIDVAEDASAESLRIGPAKEEQSTRTSASQGVLGRIGNFFAQPRRLALAACVLIAASVSFKLINQGSGSNVAGPGVTAPGGSGGPQVAGVTPTPVDIRVGPSYTPGFTPGENSTVTSIQIGPPSGSPFGVAGIADWARNLSAESRSIIGQAATRPEEKSSDDNGSVFPPR